jgi:hypothetical protein
MARRQQANATTPLIIATTGHVFARIPAHVIASAQEDPAQKAPHNAWNAVKLQRQALWTAFREEAQELRQALLQAKARGDCKTVKEVC